MRSEWESNNETVTEFFDRLEEATLPRRGPAPDAGWNIPAWFERFRLHCEVRELAGRKTFGNTFHNRDNCREAQEEAADAALYSFFQTLVSRRAAQDENYELALTAAFHAAKLHEALDNLRSRRHEPISTSLSPP